MIKKIFTFLGIALLLFQLYRPAKNVSGMKDNAITTKYALPQSVKYSLDAACMDCHSNTTKYPWYSNIQPIASFLNGHVKEGKKHLNFDEFTSKRIAIQNHKLEEIIEMVEENEMPLASYTWMHPEAKLKDNQKKELVDWAKSTMAQLAVAFPPDSLILKKK